MSPKFPTPGEYIKNRIGTLESEIVMLLEAHAAKDVRIAELEGMLAKKRKRQDKP